MGGGGCCLPDQRDVINQSALGVVQARGFDAQFVAGDREQVGKGAVNRYDLEEEEERGGGRVGDGRQTGRSLARRVTASLQTSNPNQHHGDLT